MYESSVPVFVHFLKSLAAILKKAEDYCAEKKIDPEVMLSQRLYPNMLALTRQVQIATDAAKGAGARLTGTANPSFPDVEKTFEELQARVAKTIAYLESITREQFTGAEARDISFKAGQREINMKGAAYLETWAKPNFFFHLTTAYDILRHNGLDIGKRDYLSGGKT
jgi:uncharacterized protein